MRWKEEWSWDDCSGCLVKIAAFRRCCFCFESEMWKILPYHTHVQPSAALCKCRDLGELLWQLSTIMKKIQPPRSPAGKVPFPMTLISLNETVPVSISIPTLPPMPETFSLYFTFDFLLVVSSGHLCVLCPKSDYIAWVLHTPGFLLASLNCPHSYCKTSYFTSWILFWFGVPVPGRMWKKN